MPTARSWFDQSLFGLRVRSTSPIPFTLPCDTFVPDVVATFGEMPLWLDDACIVPQFVDRDEAPYALARAGDAYVLDYPDATRIVVATDALWMTWREPLNFDDACTYLIGPAFALLGRMRGAACIHASAVTIGGSTIAFAGASGTGKSTLAAALMPRGATLVAEDVLQLLWRDGGIVALPAYGGIRLWPEAVELLTGSRDALPIISPTWDKRILQPERFASEPRALGAILFLEDRDEDLSAAAAAMRLVAHSYRAEMLDVTMRRNEFAIFSEAAATLPMRAIRATHDVPPDTLAAMVIDVFSAV